MPTNKDMDDFAKIKSALQSIADHGTSVDTGAPRDLWVTIGGTEYLIEVSHSARQQIRNDLNGQVMQ